MGSDPQPYDAVLARLQAAGRLPSVVAAVARGGEPVWSGALSVDPTGPEVSPGTSYRIGSITKTLTAVLVLQLRDEGRLGLDDPVGRFVGEAGGYADVSLTRLLSHTGGLQSEPVGSWWERTGSGGAAALLAANDGAGRVAAAGEWFHYSNLGYALLGEVVARLRGVSWWQAVRERLLEPLGMSATDYHPPADHAPGRSVDHFAHTLTPEPLTDTGAMAPAGQLWSTTADLLRWADFLVTGHPDVLGAATLEEMARPVPPAALYGLGVRRAELGPDGAPGTTLWGHTGSMPGFLASLFVDRATRDAAVLLTNATTGLDTAAVPGQLLAGLPVDAEDGWERWAPSVAVPAEASELLGVWFWGNTAFGLEWHGEQLLLRDLRFAEVEERFTLDGGRIVGTAGYHRGERLRVHRSTDGTVSHLECATFVYTRTPYDVTVPIPGGHPRSS
ncbi:beta-lactamase family protein [Nocardioides sp. zg-536]|uniref:Beta-lactamase family protein n=1 Tax=Nocardioides faecalis TaxID=2803858 RepID=A0A938Y4M2_9ACTN|nr:serine hydrolase domain-containing protein [Nocardioides faecalis]MBM9459112.1 beta-lactamase family protein [Nocardioides faecalis]QVI57369.1 beta-lactamase family protein [Nocardioides faecalis]